MKKLLQIFILFYTFQLYAVEGFPNLPTAVSFIGKHINFILNSVTNFRPCIVASFHDIENAAGVAFLSWKHCLIDFLRDSKDLIVEYETLVLNVTKQGFDISLYCLNLNSVNDTVSCTKEITFKTAGIILSYPQEIVKTFQDFTDRLAYLNECANKNTTAFLSQIDNVFYNIKSCVIKGFIYQKFKSYG